MLCKDDWNLERERSEERKKKGNRGMGEKREIEKREALLYLNFMS